MEVSAAFLLELGAIVLLLAVLARLAIRLGLSPIPFYLLGGLAFGEGGIIPVVTSEAFIAVGAELGVILLLLMLGLEFTGEELLSGLRSSTPAGLVDLALNFTPGLLAGLILGFGVTPALFLGGVTYISSSGVVSKLLADLGWLGNQETPVVLSILVFEDLAMAAILPLLGVAALGSSPPVAVASMAVALAVVVLVLLSARRYGHTLSRLVFSRSDEVNVLTLLGITLLVAGLAEELAVSAAVGAFLVGIGISGEAADRARALLTPLRDIFAGVFFVFFGLRTDPAVIPGVAVAAVLLALVSGATKVGTGWWAAGRRGAAAGGRLRAGVALLARGEFSIVIAGLAATAGAGARFAALAATYVLIMATTGPLAVKVVDRPRAARPRSARA